MFSVSSELISELENVIPVFFFQFIMHPDGTFHLPYISQDTNNIFEYSFDDFKKDPNLLINVLNHYDPEDFAQGIIQSAQNLTVWSYQNWVKLPSGQQKFIRAKSKPHRNPDGSTSWYGIFFDETERKELEVLINRNELILKALNKVAKVGGFYGIHDKNNINNAEIFWSDEAYSIFGIPAKTPISLDIIRNLFDGATKEYFDKNWNDLLNTEKPFDIEILIKTGQGQEKWIRFLAAIDFAGPTTAHTYGAYKDITHRKKELQQLSVSEARFKSAFDFAPIGMALVSTTGQWLKINKSLSSILGYLENEINQLTFQDLTFPEDLQKDLDLYQQVLDKKIDSYQIEKRYIHKNGHLIWALLSVSCVRDNLSNTLYFISQITDITHQKDIVKELINAKDLAEQAAKAKSQFLSTMSHEIRTPMNAVIGITHLLLHNEPRPEQLENLKVLKFSAENLLGLVNDILDFSKIEEGKVELEEIEFNIRELVTNIRGAQIQKAEEKNLRLRLMLDDDLPEFLIGDPVRIGQVLTNLLNNAIKFTQKGSVTLEANLIKTEPAFTYIDFKIIDTGIGISYDKVEYIFDLFTQASADTTRKFGGTGLGLAITKKLLLLHGASIVVNSKPDEGTTFSFQLKLRNTDKPNVKTPAHKHLTVSLKGMKLLLAEDNQLNIFIASQFLRNWEITFDVAKNGLEVLEKIKEQAYDIILMDLQMPEMDGYEATREIRKHENVHYQNIPIIALTASAMIEIKDQVFAVGMNDYISKPFNPDDLYQKIMKYMPKR